MDSHVSGLRYISKGTNGELTEDVTNEAGEFKYYEGGTVEFFVGNISLGKTQPSSITSAMDLAADDTQKSNIVRLLQTLDSDGDPSNGIAIPSTVAQNATNNTLNIDIKSSNFELQFNLVKSTLLKDTAFETRSLVAENTALEHATVSDKLSKISEMPLGKALANSLTYQSSAYNTTALQASQKKRVYLYIWEKMLQTKFSLAEDLAKLNSVESKHDFVKKWLDYTDTALSLYSLSDAIYGMSKKAGASTIKYQLTELSAIGVGSCSGMVKLYNANGVEIESDSTLGFCNAMLALTPLTVDDGLVSDFLTKALPELMYANQWNVGLKGALWSKHINWNKADYASIALSVAKIGTDSFGAIAASYTNETMTDKLIARIWLQAHFASGFDKDYRAKLLTENSELKTFATQDDEIEYLARKYGTTGAICDMYKFLNPLFDTNNCSINYDIDNVKAMISDYLAKAKTEYANIESKVGYISDKNAVLGILDLTFRDTTPDTFTFVDKQNVALNTLIESAPITVSGINTASPISITNGEYSINDGSWTSTDGNVTDGQTVKVRHTSSNSNSTDTNSTLTIGGVVKTFKSTTKAAIVAVSKSLLRTGQTTSYATYDDGWYASQGLGIARTFTRDSTKNIVTDNATGLVWQDDTTPATMTWVTAGTYCENLTLGSFNDWRLPSIEELATISNKSTVNPSKFTEFQNIVSGDYWSSTTDASYSDLAWNVGFNGGFRLPNYRTTSDYVRCVRAGQ